MTDIQELTKLWNGSDVDINESISINKQLLKEVTISKVRNLLTEIKWNSIIGIAISFWFAQYLIGFILDNYAITKFLIPAVMLLVFTIAEFIQSIYQLVLYYTIHSDAPIIIAQKKVARLKYIEELEINALLILIPLFWCAFLIVVAWSVFDVDIFEWKNVLVYQLIGSIVVAVLITLFLRKHSDGKLKTAAEFLDEIADKK